MHPYLPHLLSDITDATRPDIPWTFGKKQSFEEEMEEIERWCEGEEAPHTFGYWCGLQTEHFPPAEQFDADELSQVCKAFGRLLFSWNLGISLPDNLPLELRYSFMVNTLNEKTIIPTAGFMDFNYCNGNAPDCVFKEYCSCLKIWNRNDNEDRPDLSAVEDMPF